MARNGSDNYIYRVGSSPNTHIALSQKNRVFSKPYSSSAGSKDIKQVGTLSTFDWSESRNVDPVRGVGFGDKIQELVPGVTEATQLTLNRTLLYVAGIVQELGYRGGVDGLVRSLRHHKWPFDLRSELVFSELASSNQPFGDASAFTITPPIETGGTYNGTTNLALVTYFEACWLNSYSISHPSDSSMIVEDAQAYATDISDGVSTYGLDINSYGDLLDAGNNPILNPGSGSRLYTGLS